MFTGLFVNSGQPKCMLKTALLVVVLVIDLTHSNAQQIESGARGQNQTVGWQLPFEVPLRLVRQYLQPSSDYSAGHRGVDYSVELGELLMAPSDGIVSVAKVLVDRPLIAISHSGGLVTEFEPACAILPVGTSVKRGEVFGKACDADVNYKQHCPNDRCLHFSLRVNGKYLSPLALIGGLNPSRLLP